VAESEHWRAAGAVPAGGAVEAAAVAVGSEPVAGGDAGAGVAAAAADNCEALVERRGKRLAWGHRRRSGAARLADNDEW
jgi:hypothetical protein